LSSAIAASAAAAALLLLGVWTAVRWGAIPGVLGLAAGSPLRNEANFAALAAGALTAGTLLVGFVGPICLSAQRGYLSSIVGMAGAGASAAALIGVAAWRPTTGSFVLASGLPPLAATMLLGVYLFAGPLADTRPSAGRFRFGALRALASGGAPLVLLQVANLAVMHSANVMIANRFGPAEVPRYSVPFAMFTTAAALCHAIVSPFWPACAEAAARGDHSWIAASLRRTLGRTLGFMAPACLAAALAGRQAIELWAGKDAVPSHLLLAAMSVYFLLVVWSMNYGVVLLGLGAVRVKAALGIFVAGAHIGGFYGFSSWLGTASIPIAGAIGLAVEVTVSRAVCGKLLAEGRR
jgi:O-antigen/teichoic acid export membrane protein